MGAIERGAPFLLFGFQGQTLKDTRCARHHPPTSPHLVPPFGVVDPDDVTIISLDYALRDLAAQCAKLMDPSRGWDEWLLLMWAVLSTHPPGPIDLHRIALITARQTTQQLALFG